MVNKFSKVKERVLYVIEYHKDNKTQFFKKIEMSYGSFKGTAKYRPLNSNAIANILSIYEDVSAEWLIMEKGPMLKEVKEKTKESESDLANETKVNEMLNKPMICNANVCIIEVQKNLIITQQLLIDKLQVEIKYLKEKK